MLDLSVGVQMDKSNLCSEGSLAVRTGNDENVWWRVAGSGLPGLPPLLCRDCPVGLARHGDCVTRKRALFRPVLTSFFPCVRDDAERFREYFRMSFKRFLWPPWERFACQLARHRTVL